MPSSVVDDHDFDLTDRFAYDASSNVEYWGKAAPGSAESDAVWKIKKFTYDASSNNTKTEFPNHPTHGSPTADFLFIWNNRASLTYG